MYFERLSFNVSMIVTKDFIRASGVYSRENKILSV